MELNAGALTAPAPAVRVLLVADVRSPTTWGWVDAVRSADVVILGVDGQPWPDHRPASASGGDSRAGARQRLRSFATSTPRRIKAKQRSRRVIGPFVASFRGRRLRRVADRAKPDVVHGLRVPYEAMTALVACPAGVPLAVSVWGNDLTLHASANRLTGRATRRVLAKADLLFADCQRDIDLAGRWGLRPTTPTAVLPGGGGIDLLRIADLDRTPTLQVRPAPTAVSRPGYTAPAPDANTSDDLEEVGRRLVVNARGCREYVRNDVLLEALSLMAADLDPRVCIVFVDAAHDEALRHSIERHRLAKKIIVTGKRSSAEVLTLFCRAEVSVSITNHDGTPNSLLEAMAAGAIPVCGDLPSIREWVEPGRNGFLAAFDDPQAVADALRIALALSDAERRAIRAENARIIAARAERGSTGHQAAEKYRQLTDAS
jgi:glycosyltransferase involved in cell wall biosynthesis